MRHSVVFLWTIARAVHVQQKRARMTSSQPVDISLGQRCSPGISSASNSLGFRFEPGRCLRTCSARYFVISFNLMSINNIKKRRRGRPRKDSEAIMVRVPAQLLADIDVHVQESSEPIGRPEAIRQLTALGFRQKPPPHWGEDSLSRFFEWAYHSRWQPTTAKKRNFTFLLLSTSVLWIFLNNLNGAILKDW